MGIKGFVHQAFIPRPSTDSKYHHLKMNNNRIHYLAAYITSF